jgi:hypothetical protein
LDEHRVAFLDFRLQLNAPASDQIKPVGRIAFTKYQFALLEFGRHRAFGQDGQMFRLHAMKKRVLGDQSCQ